MDANTVRKPPPLVPNLATGPDGAGKPEAASYGDGCAYCWLLPFPFSFMCWTACAESDYELHPHHDDPDRPAKEPCEDQPAVGSFQIKPVDWDLAVFTMAALSGTPEVEVTGPSRSAEDTSGFGRTRSERFGGDGYLGRGLYTRLPAALAASTCGYYDCPGRDEFGTAGAIWTYIHARRDPNYVQPTGSYSFMDYDFCGVFFDSREGQSPNESYFVNAFVPFLTYAYEMEYGECGWVMKVRFWAGMINNFSVFAVTPDGERLFDDALQQGSDNWLGTRAHCWFSGIKRTVATVRAAREVDGGFEQFADEKEWICDLSGEEGFKDAPDLCTPAIWRTDELHLRRRDPDTRRYSALGNMLRGEIRFSPTYTAEHTLSEMVYAAFWNLFGDRVEFEQQMEYFPAEGPGSISQTATVRAMLRFSDAEPKQDLLDRLEALNRTNPNIFQTDDRYFLEQDTFWEFPAGWTNPYHLTRCEYDS